MTVIFRGTVATVMVSRSWVDRSNGTLAIPFLARCSNWTDGLYKLNRQSIESVDREINNWSGK